MVEKQISFKEWLELDEARFKGLKKLFLQQHPNMPKYVANDLYNTRIGYTLGRHMGGDTRAASLNSPQKIFGAFNYQNMQWVGPRPLQGKSGNGITPSDFTNKTQERFFDRRFGFRVETQIANDGQRTTTQKNILNNTQAGENVPVIVVHTNRGYELLEGWHRTMNLLLQGAPEDQIAVLRNDGYLQDIDFRKWRPVQIKAYMGVDPSTIQATPSSQLAVQNTANVDYQAGTGEYIPTGSTRSLI